MADTQPTVDPAATDAPVVDPLVGVADGAEVVTHEGEPTGEVVVYEYDADGNVTGWHKEPAGSSK